jgi:formylglycine-generating enzyme required for sulfatase activity
MSEPSEIGIRALQEKLEELAQRRSAIEERLRVLMHSEAASRDAEPTVAAEGAIDVVNGVYVGERPRGREEQVRAYRRVIAQRTGAFPVHGVTGIDHGALPGEGRLDLTRVYVGLDTDLYAPGASITEALRAALRGDLGAFPPHPGKGAGDEGEGPEPRRLSAMEIAILRPRQVLLGEPGSGKTTFLYFIAHALATGDEGSLSRWPAAQRDHLPILVHLRELAPWLGASGADPETDAGLLWDFLLHDLRERNLGFLDEVLREEVEQGRFVLLLDGLDEIPAELASSVSRSIEDFEEDHPAGRYLISSRTLAYQSLASRLPEYRFPVATLSPLSQERIDRFIDAWYAAIAGAAGIGRHLSREQAARLREAVRRPGLRAMAGNPMLLTVMALVHAQRGEVPEARAQVYEQALGILLWRRERQRRGNEPRLTDLLRAAGRDRIDLIMLLERIAFGVRGGRRDGWLETEGCDPVSGIGEDALIEIVRGLHPEKHLDWGQKVVDLLKLRSGLIAETQPGALCLPHRGLQEYLAGSYLAHSPDFAADAAGLVEERRTWRETILNAVGFLVHNQREIARPLQLADVLCSTRPPSDDTGWRRIRLAGEVLLEIGLARVREDDAGSRLLGQVARRMAALLERGVLSAAERSQAGDVLGRLGDPRFDHARFRLPQNFRGEREKAIGLISVKPGAFPMGSREGDLEARADELGNPPGLAIDYRYWIGRYPVTVAAFDAFVRAAGYETKEWWDRQGWSWRNECERQAPRGWEVQRGYGNRPVVGVTWFEGMAYAAWLDAQLRMHTGHIPEGYLLRLPTEAEWEKAARGEEGRRYAWGDDWDAERGNVGERIAHPTAVGIYPLGATPTGAMDMTGNVLEWCLTAYRPYPYTADGRDNPGNSGARVARGGSWLRDGGIARAACRLHFPPQSANGDLGFRLVLSRGEPVVSAA